MTLYGVYVEHLLVKKTVLWNVTSCSMVNTCQIFGGMYCLGDQGRRVLESVCFFKSQ